jgi:hypothetical protein
MVNPAEVANALREYANRGTARGTNHGANDLNAAALIEAQQDEIERLRALIRFYADAHDGITLNWSVDRKGHWGLFDAADKELLKEARRG